MGSQEIVFEIILSKEFNVLEDKKVKVGKKTIEIKGESLKDDTLDAKGKRAKLAFKPIIDDPSLIKLKTKKGWFNDNTKLIIKL